MSYRNQHSDYSYGCCDNYRNRYIFVALTANLEDIIFDGEWFAVDRVDRYRSYKQYKSLKKLVRFLNGNGSPTSLYFCDRDCVWNYDKEGHYHVDFQAEDLDDAHDVLQQFMPNYHCDEVYEPSYGIDSFYDGLIFIGCANANAKPNLFDEDYFY